MFGEDFVFTIKTGLRTTLTDLDENVLDVQRALGRRLHVDQAVVIGVLVRLVELYLAGVPRAEASKEKVLWAIATHPPTEDGLHPPHTDTPSPDQNASRSTTPETIHRIHRRRIYT